MLGRIKAAVNAQWSAAWCCDLEAWQVDLRYVLRYNAECWH